MRRARSAETEESEAELAHKLDIGKAALDELARDPHQAVEGMVNGCPYHAAIAIPDYGRKIASHFACGDTLGLRRIGNETSIPFNFQHFGLICTFEDTVELAVHDDELTLDDALRRAVARFGPLIIRNVHLPRSGPKEGQRNIFPHLKFHFDRGPNQPTQYSLFTRDPFDAVQIHPRDSSTVFVANIVAHLQYAKEQGRRPADEARRSSYDIFLDEPMEELLGAVVMEQAWDAPEGTGEISLLYNRTVLHASYYRTAKVKGYPIGVRYLK